MWLIFQLLRKKSGKWYKRASLPLLFLLFYHHFASSYDVKSVPLRAAVEALALKVVPARVAGTVAHGGGYLSG
jgi:hypothetical protein